MKRTFQQIADFSTLLWWLREVDEIDQSETPDYDKRYRCLLEALIFATSAGVPSGIRLDPEEPEWPVMFFELPTGQVSWHLPQHVRPWDGHTNEEKHDRIVASHTRQWGEPTQPVGTCSRCGQPLNNVSPGFSVVAGGAFVCAPCLRPGEELLRARGITQ